MIWREPFFGHRFETDVLHWTDSGKLFHHFSFLQFYMKDATIIFPSPGLHSLLCDMVSDVYVVCGVFAE